MKLILGLIFMFMFEFSKAHLNIQKRIILIVKGSLTSYLRNRKNKNFPDPLRSSASVNVKGDENRLRSLK
jgi:hypothetical protein